MRNVMTKAWEIAREGARKFGGNVSEYFAEALRMAWTLIKKGAMKMNLTMVQEKLKEIGNDNWSAREWSNYGKQRVYFNFKGKGKGFMEIAEGKIKGINVDGQINRLFADMIGTNYDFGIRTVRHGICPKCKTYCYGDC